MRAGLVATLALLLAAAPAAAAGPRFFVTGPGTVAIENAHTKERLAVRYRADDGTYDADALDRLARLFRSRGDGAVRPPALRLVEVLAHVQHLSGAEHLVLYSGYRSPDYNRTLQGAAKASMHTEGLAADVGFARPTLPLATIWQRVRALECCGAGYYAPDGYLHLDVGRPRFWEKTTSRVGEDLAGGNARVFARTDWDRYAPGEPIVIRLHSVTLPPIRLARDARLGDVPVRLDGDAADGDCLTLAESGAAVRIAAAPAAAGTARAVLTTCAPRLERTPETIETNPLAVDLTATQSTTGD